MRESPFRINWDDVERLVARRREARMSEDDEFPVVRLTREEFYNWKMPLPSHYIIVDDNRLSDITYLDGEAVPAPTPKKKKLRDGSSKHVISFRLEVVAEAKQVKNIEELVAFLRYLVSLELDNDTIVAATVAAALAAVSAFDQEKKHGLSVHQVTELAQRVFLELTAYSQPLPELKQLPAPKNGEWT